MFENRLVNLREEIGKTKKEVAAALNMPYNTYSNYENDNREPNSEVLIKIADFYNVSIDYLLGLTDIKSVNSDVQTACKVTGLSESAVNHLHYINYEENILGKNGKILDLLIESIDNSLLFDIRSYFSIKEKRSLWNRIILTKFCKDNNLDISEEEIFERGEYIFHLKYRENKAFEIECNYSEYKDNIKFQFLKYSAFDNDLTSDLEYMKYKIYNSLNRWIFDEFPSIAFDDFINEDLKNKYCDLYNKAINCIFDDEKYKVFLSENFDNLPMGISYKILNEKNDNIK